MELKGLGWEETIVKSRLMLVMAYLGAVIGAGFASGQEIVRFFVIYGGHQGLKGAVFATFAFAFCGGILLYLAHNLQVSNYQDLLARIFGNRRGKIIDWLLAAFLFLGIATMLSASGAVFSEHLGLAKGWGILSAFLLIIGFLLSGKKGLVFSFNLLVPIKITFLLIAASYVVFFMESQPPGSCNAEPYLFDDGWWVLSSMLYVAYNFSLAMVVLSEYQNICPRREGIAGAAWGGLILGALLLLSYLSLSKFHPAIMDYEIPMLYLMGNISPGVKRLYTLVLWIGILTTAIANAYGFTQRLADFSGLGFGSCLVLTMTLSLPIAMQSFSSLVAKVYPLFGLLGIIIVAALLYRGIKDMAFFLYYNIKN